MPQGWACSDHVCKHNKTERVVILSMKMVVRAVHTWPKTCRSGLLSVESDINNLFLRKSMSKTLSMKSVKSM